MLHKLSQFDRRTQRVRRSLAKYSGGRPRLSVFRSSKHIYAQVIDDAQGPHAGRGVEPGEGAEDPAQDRRRQGGRHRRRQAAGRAGEEGRRRQGGVRSRRLSLSRPHQGAGRRGARRRPQPVIDERTSRGAQHKRQRPRSRPRRSRQRVQGQARAHQPRGQGGQGRQALRLRGAGGGGRPEGPRRLRPRQGPRGAGGDPQGDGGGAPRPRSACPCARGARCTTTREGRHGAGKVVLRSAPPGTGIIAGGPTRAVFEMLGVHDVVAKSLGSHQPLQHGARHLRRAQGAGESRARWRRGAARR